MGRSLGGSAATVMMPAGYRRLVVGLSQLCPWRAGRAVAVLAAVVAATGCAVAETTTAETANEGPTLTVLDGVEAEPVAYLDCDFSDHADTALDAVWRVSATARRSTSAAGGGSRRSM